MDNESAFQWETILTAVVAIYGAGLATYSFIVARRDRTPRLKVELYLGWIAQGKHAAKPRVFVSVANSGKAPVTITALGVQTTDKRRFVFIPPPGIPELPYELSEGRPYATWQFLSVFIGEMRHIGYSGSQVLVSYARDGLGNEYYSPPFVLDLDEWQEES